MFHRLLVKCADYPELYIDWRSNDAKLNAVKNQLDIGIQAEDLMIVRKICDTTDKIVASPAYLARHGTPQIDANTNRPWAGRSTQKCTFFQKTSVSSQTTLPTNSPLRWQAALPPISRNICAEPTCKTANWWNSSPKSRAARGNSISTARNAQ